MKKIIHAFAIVMSLSFAGNAIAGAGHSHGASEPVSKDQATERAVAVKQQLVSSEQIGSTWAQVSMGTAKQRSTSEGKLWVVQFDNPDSADENRAKLFVFVDEFGNPIGANHSGKL
jgi:hypothetical protein